MTDKITIREKKAVQARVTELNTHKQSVATQGTLVTAQITALSAALTATAGSGADPVPSGVSTKVQAQFDAAATKLGSTSGKLQSWLDGQTVIQEEGGTSVTRAGEGSGSKPETPKPTPTSPKPVEPTVKPYSTSGGSTGGTSPYPAAK